MDKEELKKKAAAFGKKALEFGVKAGKEIASEAAVVGKSLMSDLEHASEKIGQKIENDRRWDKREGVLTSQKIFPQAFEDVEVALRTPLIEGYRLGTRADSTICRITAECRWTEDIPGYPNSQHAIYLQLDFKPVDATTEVTYTWRTVDFPKGWHTGILIRRINSWVEAALEGTGEPLTPERM